MLDAGQRQHVRLWVRANLMANRLQPRDHVVQRDTLFNTVLFARQELGRQFRLLAWGRTASDRAGNSGRVEDPVA